MSKHEEYLRIAKEQGRKRDAALDAYELLKKLEHIDSGRYCPLCLELKPNHENDCSIAAYFRKVENE